MPITEEKIVEELLEEVFEEDMIGYSPLTSMFFFVPEENFSDKEIFMRVLAHFTLLTYDESQTSSPFFRQNSLHLSRFEKTVYEGILTEANDSEKVDTLLQCTSKEEFEKALLAFVGLDSIYTFVEAYEDEINRYLAFVSEDFLEYQEDCLETLYEVAEEKFNSDYLDEEDDDDFF